MAETERPERASRRFPLPPALRGYRRGLLRGDVVAGLTVWAVLVPEALAYATIAGVPPVVGLYAAPAALVAYALLGTSRVLVVGPMSATAALSASTLAGLDPGDAYMAMTAALALMTGIVAVAAGLLRLGFLAGFISEPVLKGFIIGLALTIVAGQLPALAGLEKEGGNAIEIVASFVRDLGDADGWTVCVGLLSLAVVLALKRFVPAVPASLAVVALGVVAASVLDLGGRGVELVGEIPGGLPAAGLPDVSRDAFFSLATGAFGIAVIGFAEGLGAAKSYAARDGYDVDPNRELVALGTANVGAGLTSGMVVNGSLSKTAVNAGAGARRQVSGLVVAVLTIVTLLFLTGFFQSLPEATLAAVVIAAVIELVDLPALARLYRMWSRRLGEIYGPAARPDFAAAVTALVGVLLFDTLPGLIIGILVSMLLLLYRSSRPNVAILGRDPRGDWVDVSRTPSAVQPEGVRVARVESGLFFANADHVRTRLRGVAAGGDVHALVLDLRTVPFVDVTAAQMLVELDRDLERDRVRLLAAHDIGQVRDVLSETEARSTPVLRTIDAAVAAAADAGGPPSERPPADP